MDVELHNVRALVTSASDDEHRWLFEYLSWPDEDVFWRRKSGYRGDGYTRLYDRVDDSFPAGFTGMIAAQAKNAGFRVDVTDMRTVPAQPTTYTSPWARPYQAVAVEKGLRRTRGVLWAATGAGKTEIAMATVMAVPVPWLFLVHRTQIGEQARKRFALRTGNEAGLIAEGVYQPDTSPHGLTVATFQTLSSMAKSGDKRVLRFLQTIQGVVVDECHVLPADSFRVVLDMLPNAYWRLGVSATPLQRGDRKTMHLFGCLGSVYHRITARELIAAGVLAEPIIRMVVPGASTSDKKTWQGVYNELVVKSRARNDLLVDLCLRARKPCIMFTKAVDHGRDLEKKVRRAGLSVEYVDGETPTSSRQGAVTRLERGDVEVLIASVVMNEGVDIPNLASVVVAAGGSSTISALQRVGRGMRNENGTKPTFEVWDVDDFGQKWTEGHAADRVKAYRVEDYDVLRTRIQPDGTIVDEPYE